MLQAHTHPPGSQESEGKTFAWCGRGLPGANNQPNCGVLLICGVYGAACRETETFAHSDKESAAARLGVSASGESPGKVPAAAESGQAGTKPGQHQCGDPCLPGTSGQCSDLTVLLTVQQVTCSPPPHMPSAFPTGSPSFIHSVHGPFFHCAALSESSPCGRHSAVDRGMMDRGKATVAFLQDALSLERSRSRRKCSGPWKHGSSKPGQARVGSVPVADAHSPEGGEVAGIRICRGGWSGRIARRQTFHICKHSKRGMVVLGLLFP